ncbi:dihydrofolate reductase family protein [Streptomyces lunaelactis]|uniref:dihydrofolate reductase family protein n=1 Tax=Streptomyces lunaelactis TaxID=1535768 RepID=UPI00158520A2|nr:dihydrofolate reductase family protein [Streptomyces lunaelactis]NUK03821.1 dihydrofolate reductase family protein [Streptomyces lunaelactis]NUK10788.1 dihydrofolate reductase family protein [Streptomyces lunaelactis]NUK17600.1 dihydrofolate reductase family protein [Streptomyces lunaelactis]NUL12745.1 dihydrofolate reductase family protein [Streptomyces lunaelactis]NUL25466.1 dihydrofolate reductase family protein [Streptomyces lunaelactis]
MSKVISGMSMSLDGFITAPDDTRENPLGVGGRRLHQWLLDINDTDAKVLDDMTQSIGAVVMGRHSYDVCEGDGGWGDGGPVGKTPCFVLTHRPPDPKDVVAPDVFTFVTDGIESAIARAKAAAGAKDVGVHGATAAQQALNAELLDGIHIMLVPVLLGSGKRLFDHVGGPVELRRTWTVASEDITHLCFDVVKQP